MMRRVLPLVCLLAAAGLYAQRGGGGGGFPNPQGQGGQGQGGQGQGAAGRQNGPNAQGGQSAAHLPPGTVEGRVMSTTGEPIRKASLTLRPNGRGGGNYSAI